MGWSIPILRVAGIQLRIHITFLLLIAWIAFAYYTQGGSSAAVGGVLFILLLFTCVVLHEFGHALAGKAFGINTPDITLLPIGGVARLERIPDEPVQELVIAAAGPAVTALIAVGAFIGGGSWDYPPSTETSIPDLLFTMNIVLLLFNLLPAFPMDGGRIFRSIAWMVTGNYDRATQIAAWTGRAFAFSGVGVGLMAVSGRHTFIAHDAASGAWLIFVALFLENAARRSLDQNRLVRELRLYRAEDLMHRDPPLAEVSQSVGSLARGVIDINPRVCYFVQDEGKLAGILSGDEMRRVPEAQWDAVTARQAMVPSARLRAAAREQLISDVLLEMEIEDLLHMPVVENGRVVGVVARERIVGLLRQAGLLPAQT